MRNHRLPWETEMDIDYIRTLVRVIERALDIGDSLVSGYYLDDWMRPSELEDEDLAARFVKAKRKLEVLQEHEREYGRFAFLDRSAPEILGYEEDVIFFGWKSAYFLPEGSNAPSCEPSGSVLVKLDADDGLQRAA